MSKTLGQILEDLNIEVGTAMTIDWQQVRIQAAIAALNGLTSDPSFDGHTLEDVAAECVTLADALVAELQK